MKCYHCKTEIEHNPVVKELKINNNNKMIKRCFCSDYCVMLWEQSEVV